MLWFKPLQKVQELPCGTPLVDEPGRDPFDQVMITSAHHSISNVRKVIAGKCFLESEFDWRINGQLGNSLDSADEPQSSLPRITVCNPQRLLV